MADSIILEFVLGGRRTKRFELRLEGTTLHIKSGRIGQPLRDKTIVCDSAPEARARVSRHCEL